MPSAGSSGSLNMKRICVIPAATPVAPSTGVEPVTTGASSSPVTNWKV
jgi:hypothetical protein